MNKQFHLTAEGIREFKEELKTLIASRAIIADKIKTAREFGDLSENAEYSAAIQEQDRTENRIIEIEYILQNVEEITRPTKGGTVQLGSTVGLRSMNGKNKAYKVVGTVEANPSEGKISDESPIGQALLKKVIGDNVEIVTPAETVIYKIVSIS
ncbi:MAG TPA: transcription elongation factor GreA [Candidatus Dormibacteraeota bacterium]|nr:transcription elongation factor GreA [Candidatus Dormibacteraeota bacterium]